MSRLRLNCLVVVILTLIVANSSVLAGKPTYSKDWREWGEMPPDSIQEDQLRIWLANESTQTMRFRIDILDRSGKVIRHFIEDNMNPGYLNVYWDKKSDSGSWVEPGEYQYRLMAQGKEKTGKLVASFDPAELVVLVYPEAEDTPGVIRYDILDDSVSVTIGVYRWRGNSVFEPIVDSMHARGSYQFEWTNQKNIRRGNYRFHLKAAGITHKSKISRVVYEKK